MFEQISKSRLVFFVALAIGGIGACGQAYLLHHELVDCLPYKVIYAGFYPNIAKIGVYFAPFIAIASGFLFGRKRFWLATIIPVLSCPLLFAVVFKAASVIREWSVGVELDSGFGDFTSAVAAQKFYSYVVSLTITGLIIGVVCSFLLLWLSKERKFV
jgi:hypothetical protein